jgi:hypothetical protein
MKTKPAKTLTGKARERLAQAWRLCTSPSVMNGWWNSTGDNASDATKTTPCLSVTVNQAVMEQLAELFESASDFNEAFHQIVRFLPQVHRNQCLTERDGTYRARIRWCDVGFDYVKDEKRFRVVDVWSAAGCDEPYDREFDVVIPPKGGQTHEN